MNLQTILQNIPLPASTGRYWVAYSGGLDSTVLLHLLKSANLSVQLCAVHVNHQISSNADIWQQHCENFCRDVGIAFFAEKVNVQKQGYGLEDAARKARYAVFESLIKKDDVLLTAHHADDQAETLLLRLLRGTGVKGLAAIATEKPCGQGRMIRPLLWVTRNELLNYAQQHNLSWVDDESNFSDIYDRNYLRLHVMPLLQKRWQGFQKKWQQAAQLCAEADSLLNEYAQMDLQAVGCRNERVGQSIDYQLFVSFSERRQQNLLRHWLIQQGYTTTEQQHWQQFIKQFFSEKTDTHINLQWGNVSLRFYQNRIYSLPLELPQLHLQQIHRQVRENEHLLRVDLPDLWITSRSGGERCRPAQRAHSQTLKKLLQEYQLEPWLRDSVPLIYSGQNLVAVGDLWICAGYLAAEGEMGIQLRWC